MTDRDKTAAKLTRRQVEILDFETRWYRSAGAKQQAIIDTLDLTSTQYYQLLAELLDHPAAERNYPAMINRLRRARDARRKARTR